MLEDPHIGLDFTGQCCTQTCTRIHLLKVNIQSQTCERTRPAGDRCFTPDPETWHLRLTEAAGVPMLRCQKSYPAADININIVIVSSWPAPAWPSVVLRRAATAGHCSSRKVCRCGNDYSITTVLLPQLLERHNGTICILTFK